MSLSLFPAPRTAFLALTLLAPCLSFASAEPSLKQASKAGFRLGAAINEAIIRETDAATAKLVVQNFDSITPENALKWGSIHPKLDTYDFEVPDLYVAFGQKYHLQTIGHTLMWHEQTPADVFVKSSPDADLHAEVRQRLIDHITTVVGRYKGKIAGWDVVNEAISDEGVLRTDKPWYKILGEEGIFLAFETAHKADPDAELYYNEYSLWNPAKRATVIDLVKRLRARGLRVDGVGLQEHYMLAGPTIPEVEEVLLDFEKAGIQVMVTELDLSTLPRPSQYSGADIGLNFELTEKYNPYVKGLPAEVDEQLATHYGQYYALYRKHAANIKRVTLWGVTDGPSWLNHWPIRGRTDYPLLFDRAGKPKKAYSAVLEALSK